MPRQRIFSALWLFVSLVQLCASAKFASAQTVPSDPRNVDATSFGERITLGPDWLFAPGDNPAWAAPRFDDSGWTTVSTENDLFEYGYHDIPYAWYRAHIHLQPGTRNLMVGLRGTEGSYEVFANGLRVGGSGAFPPIYRFSQPHLGFFSVPDGVITPRGDLVLAIRFGLDATGELGRGSHDPLSSDSAVYLLSSESAAREASYVDSARVTPFIVLSGLGLLVGLVAFALFAALRTQREYLAAAIQMFSWSIYYSLQVWMWSSAFTFPLELLNHFVLGLAWAAMVEFLRLVLGLKRSPLIVVLEVVCFFDALSIPFQSTPFWTFSLAFFTAYLPLAIVDTCMAILLARGWIRGNVEARVLLPALLLVSLDNFLECIDFMARLLHSVKTSFLLPNLHLGGYTIATYNLTDSIYFITILLFLVLRTVGIARQNAKVAGELEAARIVQQVIIPEEIPAVPGFMIDSVYKPHGEVGGDFFQIVATKNGGVLVAIGDVSGKGMPAAMTVSLLVGTLRTLAHYTSSPGEILSAMNQRMIGRANGGFTTCLVLRADPGGLLTLANAGHVAPYVNGCELPIDSGLPLGLEEKSTYVESTFQLNPKQQLTLITDGVVEARNQKGELLGFDRSASLSTQPAESIAVAAQAFGQDDDITVLTLERMVPA